MLSRPFLAVPGLLQPLPWMLPRRFLGGAVADRTQQATRLLLRRLIGCWWCRVRLLRHLASRMLRKRCPHGAWCGHRRSMVKHVAHILYSAVFVQECGSVRFTGETWCGHILYSLLFSRRSEVLSVSHSHVNDVLYFKHGHIMFKHVHNMFTFTLGVEPQCVEFSHPSSRLAWCASTLRTA